MASAVEDWTTVEGGLIFDCFELADGVVGEGPGRRGGIPEFFAGGR